MVTVKQFFGLKEVKTPETNIAEATINAEMLELERQITSLRESAGIAALKLEDYMWSPIGGWEREQGFTLQTIKEEADHCRALYAVNPLIKKAVTARVGMVHGRGARIVTVDGKEDRAITRTIKQNKRKVFGDVARARLEAELSVAGNVWAMRRSRDSEVIIVPIQHISGYITEFDDPSKVLYWKRSFTSSKTNIITGEESVENITEYIPTNAVTNPPRNIGDFPVRRDAVMFHVAANRQENWILGLPDLFAAKFWARGHKEMFEAGHEFTLAQGKIAAKVTANNQLGAQLTASRLAEEPRRDYETGEIYGYGGTAVMQNGLDYQLVGKMGNAVDFKSYDRVAGLIAAGTGVPVDVILAESSSEEVSLEFSVIEDMKLRQSLWGEFYEDLFSPKEIQAVWPRIKQETVYRVQQAVEIANRTNTLHQAEKRLLTLEGFGLEGDPAATPDIMEHPDVQVYLAKKKIDLEYASQIAEAEASVREPEENIDDRSTTPDQGNDEGIGKLSDGEDAHDARDAGEQEHTR